MRRNRNGSSSELAPGGQRLRARGVEVRAVGDEPVVPQETVRAAVDGRTRVIAVSLVSYLTGHRHDLRALRVMADRAGARLVVDASHALGVVAVDASLADVVVAFQFAGVKSQGKSGRSNSIDGKQFGSKSEVPGRGSVRTIWLTSIPVGSAGPRSFV